LKVFLSSTVTDLAEYREAARRALTSLGIEYVSLDSLPLDSIPTKAVLQELAQADVVVVIVGHRYGSIEPQTGRSWVEEEFEAARKMGKPILAFLAAEEAPWPASAIDKDRRRVETFREKLLSNYLVSFFHTPGELESNLVASLVRLTTVSAGKRVETAPRTTMEDKLIRSVRILRVLLSSPGDVSEERESCSRAVFRFNQQEVEEHGIFLKLVRWEDMAPQIGPGAQNVINEQIGEYDIFSGIMWNRFGTPTDIAASGTEEEFRAAVSAWEERKRPWITFYFCERPANFTNAQQLEQKSAVLRFRSELQTLGVVRKYISVEEFENLIFQDLLKITNRKEFQA
jgi:uncharacterized protein DUF4062